MIFEPQVYYQAFPADYHKFKVITLKKILEDLDKYELEFFDRKLDKDQSKKFELTLRSEIRQAYFHCSETLFELINALCPESDGTTHELNILPRLTNAKTTAAYDRASDIVNSESGLVFLDKIHNNIDYPVTIGHFLFFYGIAHILPADERLIIDRSLKSIKILIKNIAKTLSDREEYNSYKHGLRLIPSVKEFGIYSKDLQESIKFDLSKSVSYYSKTKNPDEVIIKTKVQDTERDIEMTMLCSRLISNIIECRRFKFCSDTLYDSGQTMIYQFDEKTVENANKSRVQAQDIVFSQKLIRQTIDNNNKNQL